MACPREFNMASYRALVGLNYQDKRVEPGDVVDDIPRSAVSWLKAQGKIELVSDRELHLEVDEGPDEEPGDEVDEEFAYEEK